MWHWNGTGWQQVTVNPAFELSGVTSFSLTNAMAVGRDFTSGKPGAPAAFQWNGSTWTLATDLPLPQGASASDVSGPINLSAPAVSDIWGTGGWLTGTRVHVLSWHWNGTSWSVTNTGLETQEGSGPIATAAISASNVWAVGFDLSSHSRAATWSAHWNGTSWTRVPTPDPDKINALNGVDAAGPHNIWAIGLHAPQGVHRTLILRWNGTSWVQA